MRDAVAQIRLLLTPPDLDPGGAKHTPWTRESRAGRHRTISFQRSLSTAGLVIVPSASFPVLASGFRLPPQEAGIDSLNFVARASRPWYFMGGTPMPPEKTNLNFSVAPVDDRQTLLSPRSLGRPRGFPQSGTALQPCDMQTRPLRTILAEHQAGLLALNVGG